MLASFFKPEYIYRPRQLLTRFARRNIHGFLKVRLPWGKEIRVSADDNVGSQIAKLGLYDLAVTEALWRLCEPGELALDVGANIGYTMFVMAERLRTGKIIAYEPHPIIFQELVSNVESLASQGCQTHIEAVPKALGPSVCQLPLFVPRDFKYHRGESSLAAPSHLECTDEPHLVDVDTLDAQMVGQSSIGVMKIDVEGFELDVLSGAIQLFTEKRVRDCVFEEHRPFPTPVTDWLQSRGYALFRIDRQFAGPRLLPPNSAIPRNHWTATNFLATNEPARAQQIFAAKGWRCLRGR